MFEQLEMPEDFHSFSAQQKLENIIERMNTIFKMEHMRFWRERFATPEQYKEEYPEDYKKNVTVAFIVVKNNYTESFDEINEVAKMVGDNDYFRILKNIVEQDVENILLEAEDA
jgi:hypothetical protein